MIKSDLIYEGKCKKIFKIKDHENKVWMEFKDTLTAYNAQKRSSFHGKGRLNRDTSSLIFQYLKNIPHHWIQDQGEQGMITQALSMIPLEVIIRNRWAGSTAKKLRKKQGEKLPFPLFELYYKEESLGDPFISSEQALIMAITSLEEIEKIKDLALQTNAQLIHLFSQSNMDLIDFKLEFGKTSQGDLMLGDEISADSCRIWTLDGKRLDKDRFRLDLGNVQAGYQQIYQNLSHSSAPA